ncbi:MAG TPA: beta-ketoacyl-ACP synthase II [Balneolaceae bacterium]|nr:beta-ketoacyl-ACP synthase II [Balneolaceae bacterium]
MSERIVITGMGAVTPIGIGVDEYWSALISGKCGIGPITRFDTDHLPVKIAAEVSGFHPEDFITKKRINQTDIFTQFALAAAREALEDITISNPNRSGIVMGSAVEGIRTVTQTQEQLARNDNHRVSPYFMPSILGNVGAAQVAIVHELKGPALSVNTACSAGADAAGLSFEKLKAGQADLMVAVGADSFLCPLIIEGLHSARALSTQNEQPEKASRPFDRNRDGFVISEGAGALVLETLSHAQKRGANIYAELVSYANTGSAYHITAPDPDGEGEIRCMQEALKQAHITVNDIDYINAHATSTPIGDRIETKSVKTVFGESSAHIPMSSTKGATGHLMGAGGITELITCIHVIQSGVIPPTINLQNKDPKCDLDYVPHKARETVVETAMSNSFGFGGQNASLIVRRFG